MNSPRKRRPPGFYLPVGEPAPAGATLAELLAEARRRLADHSQTPSLDAQTLMVKAVGLPRGWVLSHAEAQLDPDQAASYRADVERCAQGVPLPYVLGWWEFYGRQYHLSPDVLIPRPETEHLVEAALRRLAARPELGRVLELGTGSGCVICSLALDLPGRLYLATDRSWPALQVCRRNLAEYQLVEQVDLVLADQLQGLDGPFDLIVSNPPYLTSRAATELPVGQREPRSALDGGPDGLDPVRAIAANLDRALAPGGELLLELDPHQMEEARAVIGAAIVLEGAAIEKDLAGDDRILWVRRVGNR
jgi:release factor glutamine methyltransferase